MFGIRRSLSIVVLKLLTPEQRLCKVVEESLQSIKFSQPSMDRKTKRLLLLVVSCSLAGVILGGTASWAESNTCLQASTVTNECLTKDPIAKTIQGMSTGLVAGAGAAFGVAWQHRHED